MDTWLRTFLQPTQPGFWILFSYVLWLPIKLIGRRWPQRQRRWLNMARWVLIPYAGLMAGSLSPRLMGLTGIDWYLTLGIGIALTVTLLVTLAIVGFLLREKAGRTVTDVTTAKSPSVRARPGWASATVLVLAAGAEQFHWSFLRGAIWEILMLEQMTIGQPGYWAVWIAALVALPEILLQPPLPTLRLIKVAILVVTSILFIFTRNFWLCWVLHAAAWTILAAIPQTDQSTSPS
jgi:hypothetical protein